MVQEPTPTLEEFIHSFYPTNWVPRNLEDLLYWEAKASVMIAPWAVRTAFLMRGGMALADAGYSASQGSLGLYRLFSRASRAKMLVTNPYSLVAIAGVGAQVRTLASPPPTEALRSEPGQTSWWRSVAQALTGTGPGIGGADLGY